MNKLTLTLYMPDGSTKIFEDIKGVEQQGGHLTFLCASTNEGLRSVTINLDLVVGFDIDGITPQQSQEEDDDEPNEGED